MDLSPEKDAELFLTSRSYDLWELIKAYWQSRHKWLAWLYTAIVLTLTIFMVGFDVAFNYWYNYFYNALQEYDMRASIHLLFIFFAMAFGYIVVAVYRYYLSQRFALGWRKWLTEQLMQRWMQKKGYYYLETFDVKTDNPDQRLQEDVNGIVTNTISLVVGLVSAITTFPAFVYILWTLSGVLTIPLGSFGVIHIHGYLVWVSILYNLIGTFITFKIGFPLVSLNFQQQQREATFRFSAIDLRSHAEQVALYRGEEHQKSILNFHFKRVLENWYQIILRQKLLLWFTGGFNQLAVLLPLLVALPNYFGKVFLLGGLMQSIRAFSSVQDSLSYLVNAYTSIADWRATGSRLTTFVDHLTEAENKAEAMHQLKETTQPENNIVVNNLIIRTPDNHVLLGTIDEKFIHGHHYVIKGESGIGKSTFIRAIAGIWPYTSGEVIFPENRQIMYLPQQPYMPIGTLAEAILFPDKTDPEMEKQLKTVLAECHLEDFIPRLNESAHWTEQLSPGEQQRIAFARVLLHKPDWVFLDESTSMLDTGNESHLYHLLKSRLPNCSIISVGHHASVDQFHEHVIDMTKYSHKPHHTFA